MSTTNDPLQSRCGRRWCQFGLSTLLLVTAAVAVVVAWRRPRIDNWMEALDGLRDEPVIAPDDLPPYYSDPIVSMRDAVWVETTADDVIQMNQELVPHGSELACLTASYRKLKERYQEPRAMIWSPTGDELTAAQRRQVSDLHRVLKAAGFQRIYLFWLN